MTRCYRLGLGATLLAVILGTTVGDNQYHIYNQYLFSTECAKHAQRQSGTRYGACISQSATSSSMYQLISYDSDSNTAQYNYTTYANSLCQGTGETTLGTTTAACVGGNPGASFYYSYARGITPWTQALSAGGVVTLYWYNQDPSRPCQGPPDSYYATGYDNCNTFSDVSSTRTAVCTSSTYEVQSYGDDACATYLKSTQLSKQTCSNIVGTTSYSTTVCALSSENFAVAAGGIEGDDDDSSLPDAAMAVSAVALVLSLAALALWGRILCRPSKKGADYGDVSASQSLLRP